MVAEPPLIKDWRRRKAGCPVTVCVAAICQHENDAMIVGASDRMLTSGDVEFEQAQTKIHNLTTSINIMVAGDIPTQTQILHEVSAIVQARVEREPQNWWSVKDVAELFYQRLSELRKRRAEEQILFPLGLDYAQLTSPSVAPDLATRLSR
jgi:hypothetical protein